MEDVLAVEKLLLLSPYGGDDLHVVVAVPQIVHHVGGDFHHIVHLHVQIIQHFILFIFFLKKSVVTVDRNVKGGNKQDQDHRNGKDKSKGSVKQFHRFLLINGQMVARK